MLVMSLHKLSAGDGYTYLTRQVAAADATERGYSSLGDYYSAKGEAPGVWMGAGLDTPFDVSLPTKAGIAAFRELHARTSDRVARRGFGYRLLGLFLFGLPDAVTSMATTRAPSETPIITADRPTPTTLPVSI